MQEGWVVSGVPVVVKRSARRRTVALQVRPGAVTLYAPAPVPLSKLAAILDARRAWVEHHLAQYEARPTSALRYEDGAVIPFIGTDLTLHFREPGTEPGTGPIRQGQRLCVRPGTAEEVRAEVEHWTCRACLDPYWALTEAWAERLGARARLGRVAVSRAAGRWGSCNATGDIRLHWKLSRAPVEVLDYVALHEAAHLLELNHSARYWAHVRRLMPDYARHRRWLSDFGHTL